VSFFLTTQSTIEIWLGSDFKTGMGHQKATDIGEATANVLPQLL
jgi:hypothetical protein